MSAELVACPQCGRNNNPLRAACIYCGKALPVPQEISPNSLPQIRPQNAALGSSLASDPITQMSIQMQQSAPGFNVILLPTSDDVANKALVTITSFGFLNLDEASSLLQYKRALPIARYATEIESRAAQIKLQGANLPCSIFSDEKLQLNTPNSRIRRLTIKETDNQAYLILHPDNTLEPVKEILASSIKMIIEGRVRYQQSQAVEENPGFGKRSRELTNAVELSDESFFLDIYTDSLETSFRIKADSFDYSTLGTKMRLTAAENLKMLIGLLREMAPQATYDNSFRQLSKLLEPIWPPVRRQESQGLRRSSMLAAGKIATRSTYYTDNEQQFNRYSRLNFFLKQL